MKKILATTLLLTAMSLASPLMAEEAPININTASAAELTELTGIGESRAADIVADREANGLYEQLDDLTRINGIGEATVESLRDQATL
ncbi:ComEA family DNA-binding protein [Kushneria aurantia]|uniref:ComEA family DNA-binding protein n=1 Tax=Kushneria aurantia TaxID=504092 RepID=A0ABV6G8I0_9GAMM|nr:ComEA family DNA-binding protein [Kushneria aurantia]